MIPTVFLVHDQLHTLQRACSILPPTLHPWLAFIIASVPLCFCTLCVFGFITQLSQQELPCSLFSKHMYHCRIARTPCAIWMAMRYRLGSSVGNFGFPSASQSLSPHNADKSRWWVHLSPFPEVRASILWELEPSVSLSCMHSFPLFLAGMCSDQIPTLFSLNLRLSLADSSQIVQFLENLL